MKATAKILTVITLILAALIGYYLLSSKLSTTVTVNVTPAVQDFAKFVQISDEVEKGSYEGVYSLKPAEAYSFAEISVEVKNYSPFPAEWTRLVIKNETGDILIINAEAGPIDIPPYKTKTLTATVMTESSEGYRGGWLDYYIFGRSHSIEVFPEIQE